MNATDLRFFSEIFSGYGGGYNNRSRTSSRKKKSKAKKIPKDNWFEELNATQCKELAKAAKLKVSGSKKDLVQRLLGHGFVNNQFSGKERRITLNGLKEECRTRLLQVSGTKFDLVLRITQDEHGTGGNTLKRAATEMIVGTDGNLQPVAKKRKPSKPNPSTMYTRVAKKCQKEHASDRAIKSQPVHVECLMEQLLDSLKPFIESDPMLVLDGCNSIVSGCADNLSQILAPGYFQNLAGLVEIIGGYVEQIRARVSQSALNELADIMMAWHDHPHSGSFETFWKKFDMYEAVHKIRHGDTVPYDKDKAKEDSGPAVGSTEWAAQAGWTLKTYHNGKLVKTVDTENNNNNDENTEEDKKPAAKDNTTAPFLGYL